MGILLLIIRKINLLYLANALYILLVMLCSVAVLIFFLHPAVVLGAIVGLGLVAVYTIKVYTFNEQQPDDDVDRDPSQSENKDSIDDEENVEENRNTEIAMEKIQTAKPYDNIDRNKSIDSVYL